MGEPSSRWRMPREDRLQPDGTPQVTGEFDAYREWLGVKTPSPTYYELLGLDDDEQNLMRIAAAADRAIARVRAHRPGPRAQQWSRLLDELKLIKEILTCPDQKMEYDVTLGSQKNKGRGKGSGKPRRPPQTHFTPASSNVDGHDMEGMSLDEAGFAPDAGAGKVEKPLATSPSASAGRVDDGLDLSYLNSPPPKASKKAPPREDELFSVPDEKLEQVDDIVLPPSIRPAANRPAANRPVQASPPSGQSATPSEMSAGPKAGHPKVRANPMLLPAKRKRQGAWRTRIISGVMTGLLIALGVYAFVFFEDPNSGDGLGDGFPEMNRSERLLTEEQRAAILAESERRSQVAGGNRDEDLVNGAAMESSSSEDLDIPSAAGHMTDSPTLENGHPGGPDNPATNDDLMPSIGTPPSGASGDPPATATREAATNGKETREARDAPDPKDGGEQADIFPDSADSGAAGPATTETSSSESVTKGMDLESRVRDIRLALSEQRLDDASSLLAQARPLAQANEETVRLDCLEQLSGLLSEYRSAVKRSMASMDAGTSFSISATSEVLVVERLPDAIRIRLAGENHLFPLNDLPLMLGRALAERGMPESSRSKMVLGAFQAVHKRARPEHLEEVRRWWTEAQEAGEDVEHLLLILE